MTEPLPPADCGMPQEQPPPPVSVRAARVQVRDGTVMDGTRAVPEETPVALTFNGTTHAVMMATPADIRAFALGFALTEGIVSSPAEILSIDEIVQDEGIEARMWIAEEKMRTFSSRRRALAGPTGCGLCGVESLAEAVKPAARVSCDLRLAPGDILAAMASLGPLQGLNHETRAVHAAAYVEPGMGIRALAEDVGRHNALDKLVGLAVTAGFDTRKGMVLLSSRVSIEMVQKAAVLGTGIIVAVSAPTALAVRTAEAAGITLCAVARADGFEIFTHPERIALASTHDRQVHVA